MTHSSAVEHLVDIQKASGSNPDGSTKTFIMILRRRDDFATEMFCHDESYKYICERIQKILLIHGYYDVILNQCYDLWEEVSRGHGKEWIEAPGSDETLWEMMMLHIQD